MLPAKGSSRRQTSIAAAAKPEQFIRDKLKDKPLGSDATRWGVKYEDVANLLYSHYNYTRVIEYGLYTIQLSHI
jgi:hypothetical protein